MKQRWLVAVVGLPALLFVLLICPPWATMLLVAALSAGAAWELLHTVSKQPSAELYAAAMVCATIQVWVVYDHHKWAYYDGFVPYGTENHAMLNPEFVMPWMLVMFLFFLAVTRYGTPKAIPFSDLCAAIVGGVVFPTMYSSIVLLRCAGDFGQMYVLTPFFIAFAGDTCSMFGGMLFGKRKMAPLVSPHKTWAGGIAGPVGSALGMLLLGFIGMKAWGYSPRWVSLMCVGVAANILGQLGDLAMSVIKREADIKDYSHLFLTHGGILDRFDSSLFIAPMVYLLLAGGYL